MLSQNSRTLLYTHQPSVDIDISLPNADENGRPAVSQSEFSKFIREIFHRPSKRRVQHSDKEMKILSSDRDETTVTLATTINPSHAEDTCLFSDSPHYIVRVRRSFEKFDSSQMSHV